MVEANMAALPALPFIRIDGEAAPWLAGSTCSACGAVHIGERTVCPACSARGTLSTIRLGETGKLHSFTIVYRSFPGIAVPFVAAIVDLDDGGTLSGTLTDIEPDPAALAGELPVRVVFRETAQADKHGTPFLAYYFTPAKGKAA